MGGNGPAMAWPGEVRREPDRAALAGKGRPGRRAGKAGGAPCSPGQEAACRAGRPWTAGDPGRRSGARRRRRAAERPALGAGRAGAAGTVPGVSTAPPGGAVGRPGQGPGRPERRAAGTAAARTAPCPWAPARRVPARPSRCARPAAPVRRAPGRQRAACGLAAAARGGRTAFGSCEPAAAQVAAAAASR